MSEIFNPSTVTGFAATVSNDLVNNTVGDAIHDTKTAVYS